MTAVYGGSFDPPHAGHAIVAAYTSQWGGVDDVWLMVSRLNPLKEGSCPAPDALRLEMAQAVAEGCSGVEASGFELDRPLPSYTIDTLRDLRRQYPERDFRLLIGSDNWSIFSKWRAHNAIIEEFGVIVYPRPGHPRPEHLPEGVEWLDDAPQVVMSSTFVRGAVAGGRSVHHLVPPGVEKILEREGLYKK